jgi:hypothetical protein
MAASDELGMDDYLANVKPLLKARCYACHGALKQEAGLRVDTVAAMAAGGDSGAAMVAGNSSASLILARVASGDLSERMPPQHEGEAFDAHELKILRAWIDGGAVAPDDEQPEKSPEDHWAFQPLSRPAVPQVPEYAPWIANPIDAFVAEQYVAQGIEPVEWATPLELVRRLFLDLTGLPPTPTELTMALKGSGEQTDWHVQLAAELLDRPQYGERWGRHWMDVWRYSDWWGLGDQLRNSQQHIWHWRDWIIQSLNDDLPYDEMIRQMLAADELYPTDLNRLRATGYLARNYFLFNRHQWMDETVEHVSKAFLGLTMNCAKCHDHKYDPLTQEDYYRLRAVFEPYHVRMDMLPGESDLERNGVPRAFDGWLDAPTYRFIRGEEKQPDTSRPMQPGVPLFFDFAELDIEPVTLPPSAWQPGRRPWVLENHMARVKNALDDAHRQRQQLEQKLRDIPADQPETGAPDVDLAIDEPGDVTLMSDQDIEHAGVHDRFETLNAKRWTARGGEWTLAAEGLEQSRDESQTAYLELNEQPPGDFEVDLQFTILGGNPYRSVGIAFDRSLGDDANRMSSEFLVYASAHAGGPKLQVAYRRAGADWQYPGEALQPLQIGINQPLNLNLKVRGRLVNASLNGGAVLAWQLPMERSTGGIALTAFTAQAVYREFRLRPLPLATQLVDPEAERLATARRLLPAELNVAKASIKLAEAELQFLQDCGQLSAGVVSGSEDALVDGQRLATVRSQRKLAWARGELDLARLQLEQVQANGDRTEIGKKIVSAEETVERLGKHYAALADGAPSQEDAKLEDIEFPVGARWTATRFKLSTTDDPDVPFPPQSSGRRTALAGWIVDRRNPMTARVAVNHLWSRHFGSPLLTAEFDLGRNQPEPPQRKLLDWLAVELIDSGWSMKHIHRLIVASSTYRLSTSVVGAEPQLARDPDNQLLWRRVPIRLESQVVRDALLMHAGELDRQMGGPSIPASEQENSRRRSIYFFHSNNDRNLLLTTFDEARVQECYRREQSIVPQQALALSNSRLVLANIHKISGNAEVGDGSDREFVMNSFRWLLGSEPSEAEISACEKALADGRAAGDTDNEARADLAWALINHHDFVTLK